MNPGSDWTMKWNKRPCGKEMPHVLDKNNNMTSGIVGFYFFICSDRPCLIKKRVAKNQISKDKDINHDRHPLILKLS